MLVYLRLRIPVMLVFFFFNDTATTEIYTLSLHDALPIFGEILSDRHVLRHLRSRGGVSVRLGGRRTRAWMERVLGGRRSEEHTSELQSQSNLVCRLLLEKKKKTYGRLPLVDALYQLSVVC